MTGGKILAGGLGMAVATMVFDWAIHRPLVSSVGLEVVIDAPFAIACGWWAAVGWYRTFWTPTHTAQGQGR